MGAFSGNLPITLGLVRRPGVESSLRRVSCCLPDGRGKVQRDPEGGSISMANRAQTYRQRQQEQLKERTCGRCPTEMQWGRGWDVHGGEKSSTKPPALGNKAVRRE